MNRNILLGASLVALIACQSEEAPRAAAASSATSTSTSTASVAAPAPRAAAYAEGSIEGALEGAYKASTALAGARYGRYHINLAGHIADRPGAVVIALARGGDAPPEAGRYALGDGHAFSGSVDLIAEDVSYILDSGELVLTAAKGDVLEGELGLRATDPVSGEVIDIRLRLRTQAADS